MSHVSEFPQLAEGVKRLHVKVHEGDLKLRVAEGTAWSLDWDAEDGSPPRLVRDGDTLHVKQSEDGWHHGRADARITAPPGLEVTELHTGSGDVDAAGVGGEAKLNSGEGDVKLRDGSGQAEVRSGSGDVQVERFDGQLKLSSGSGDVRCVDARGRLQVHTGHGDVQAVSVEGSLEVRTGSGDVQVRLVGATELNLDTGSGDVEISGGSLRGLHARTGAGDLSCRASLLPGAYELNTGSGDAEIEVPADARVRVNVQTGMGDIHSDFPLVRVGRSGPMGFGGGRMVGSTGEGEPEIELSMRTGSGDLSIRRAGASGGGVHVDPSVVSAGGWEARIDDEAGELTLRRSGEGDPMVSVPMPRGIGGFVRRAIREAMGGARWDVDRVEKDAERAVERATREAGRVLGMEGAAPPSPPSPPAPPEPPEPSRPVPPQDEATLKVLEALARGEISVDDAQTLLNKR